MNRSVVALFATLASLAVILAVAVAGAMGGGRAPTSHVGCGAVITTDTMLDSDLVDCANNGIVIGADGVTLDLNGHRIDGDGTQFADCPNSTDLRRRGAERRPRSGHGQGRLHARVRASVFSSSAPATTGSGISPRPRTCSSAP